jgi:hypothetical protein
MFDFEACRIGLYILELEDDNYYVGITRNGLDNRITQHFTGNGAKWTKEYHPVSIHDYYMFNMDFDIEFLEDVITLEMMEEKGWKNVRGGSWCQVDMPRPPARLAEKS